MVDINAVLALVPVVAGFTMGKTVSTSSYDATSGGPPRWVFPVVWTVLYILLGYSAYRIGFSNEAIILWWVGLLLNLMWTPVYFGQGDNAGGKMIIEALLFTTVMMAIAFFRVDRTAGLLQIPYLVWLIYARTLIPLR